MQRWWFPRLRGEASITFRDEKSNHELNEAKPRRFGFTVAGVHPKIVAAEYVVVN
jgi:hypothetical protein